MVDINLVYKSNSNNLKAEDLGNDMPTFTIANAELKQLGNDGSEKIVLSFRETEKELPLNVTNAKSVAELFGDDTERWPGGQIMLFSTSVDFQGTMTKGIRIRPPQPPQQNTGGEQNFDERNPPPAQGRNY